MYICNNVSIAYNMSDYLSIKDMKANANRLMQEKDYKSALKNWLYIKKNKESLDPSVFYNMGICHEKLDSTTEAAKSYKQAITIMVENKELLESKLFLESLLALGEAQKFNNNEKIWKNCGKNTRLRKWT